MLTFGTLPAGLPDLAGLTVFPDHRDAKVLFYLPPGMELANTPGGDPDFYLLRYHGDFALAAGGLLRFRLRFSSAADKVRQAVETSGYKLRQTGFDAGRFHLRLRSMQQGAADQTGDWRPLALASDEVSVPALSLTPLETQFLEALLSDGVSAVEIDSELSYSGLVPGAPWLVTIDVTRLRPLLTALLPASPVRADQVAAAFLSLPEGDASPITWRALQPDAPAPARDAMLNETAARALPLLFDAQPASDVFTPALYTLRAAAAGDAAQLPIDLIPPRQQSQICRLSWSVTSLYKSLDTPEKKKRIFPPVSNVSPFANVDVNVINRLPYDSHYLRKATVDLRYIGASGVEEVKNYTFDGTSQVFRTNVTYPSQVGDFQLDYRVTTFLSAPGGNGWPVIRKSAFTKADGPVVDLNRQAAGMDFVHVETEPQVFEKAASVAVSIYRPADNSKALVEVQVAADHPSAWVALPGVASADALRARVVAHAPGTPEPPPYTIGDGPIADRRVAVTAWQLEVLDPDRITVRVDPAAAPRFAMLNITLAAMGEEGRAQPLTVDAPITWSLFRNSVFDQITYRYRLNYILLDANGQARPIATTDWVTSHETNLVVGLPGGA